GLFGRDVVAIAFPAVLVLDRLVVVRPRDVAAAAAEEPTPAKRRGDERCHALVLLVPRHGLEAILRARACDHSDRQGERRGRAARNEYPKHEDPSRKARYERYLVESSVGSHGLAIGARE